MPWVATGFCWMVDNPNFRKIVNQAQKLQLHHFRSLRQKNAATRVSEKNGACRWQLHAIELFVCPALALQL